MTQNETVPFKVASHLLEDLGLTLYTSLARVLVEFVANAYDADASCATITYDSEAIEAERKAMRSEYEAEKQRSTLPQLRGLEERVLPDQFRIVIEDDGHGMSRRDLEEKFLIAGRRRLEEEPEANGLSREGRPLMGRKGLGKLAGFGVAKFIEVTSRAAKEEHATTVTLDFDDMLEKGLTEDILVPITTASNGGGLPATGGTRISMARLLHGPTKNQPATVMRDMADHFAMVDQDDFGIIYNENLVEPSKPTIAYAWPEPDRPVEDLIEKQIDTDSGETISFKYRLRFTADRQALRAEQRGIRVYAHKRLCASPSLLNADTNMHGFRMADYLYGVVHADFVAEQKTDYIATDRHGLRWEAPLLQPMHTFLSSSIKEACKRYQEFRDKQKVEEVREDPFTNEAIEKAGLANRDTKMAHRIASMLSGICKQGVADPEYKDKLPPLVQAIGHGDILTAITKLSLEPHPDINILLEETARLTHDELGRFMSTVRGRLRAIDAFRKIVADTNFSSAENERTIQKLFEDSPWLIDPTFTQFLSADNTKRVMFERLASHLKIGEFASSANAKNNERPDLVFVLGSQSLQRVVVVELKSANLALDVKHLQQLKLYMDDTSKWLDQQGVHMDVRGILIGSRNSPASNAKGKRLLEIEEESQPGQPWNVMDYMQVLEQTEAAHHELLQVHANLVD